MKPDSAATPRAVIVISSVSGVSSALERDLAELGRTSVRVATLREAMTQLEAGVRFDTAIVGLDLDDADQANIIEYLIDRHVDVRRILLSEEPPPSSYEDVAAGRVHAVLQQPWHPRNLRHVLRREELYS